MDDGTLRTNMHVVLGLDEPGKQKHRYFVYYYYYVWCVWAACPVPAISHQSQRLQNELRVRVAFENGAKWFSSSWVWHACRHSCLSTLHNFTGIHDFSSLSPHLPSHRSTIERMLGCMYYVACARCMGVAVRRFRPKNILSSNFSKCFGLNHCTQESLSVYVRQPVIGNCEECYEKKKT